MTLNAYIPIMLSALLTAGNAFGLSKPDIEYKIFQFPADKIPCIDGNTEDWDIVPDSYTVGTDQLIETTNNNAPVDPKNLDIKVTVGWGKRPQPAIFPL